MSASSVGSACCTNCQNCMVDTLLFRKEMAFDCEIHAIYLLITHMCYSCILMNEVCIDYTCSPRLYQ